MSKSKKRCGYAAVRMTSDSSMPDRIVNAKKYVDRFMAQKDTPRYFFTLVSAGYTYTEIQKAQHRLPMPHPQVIPFWRASNEEFAARLDIALEGAGEVYNAKRIELIKRLAEVEMDKDSDAMECRHNLAVLKSQIDYYAKLAAWANPDVYGGRSRKKAKSGGAGKKPEVEYKDPHEHLYD